MSLDRDEFLKTILRGYTGSYDIELVEEKEESFPLAARAALHMQEAGYFLTRKAQTWAANSDEYVFFYSLPHADLACVRDAIQQAYEEGMSKIDIKANPDHMCTRIVAVFICDEADADAVEHVRKCRLYKSFQMSLKGWMEFHAIIVDLGKGSVEYNRYGRETAKFCNNVLHPKTRKQNKKSLWGIFKR